MLFLFLPSALALNTTLLSLFYHQENFSNFTEISKESPAEGIQQAIWSYTDEQAYSKALFNAPSPLPLLMSLNRDHRLLPDLHSSRTHQYLEYKDQHSVLKAFYVDTALHAVSLSFDQTAMKPLTDPFDPNRLASIQAGIHYFSEQCENWIIRKNDPYLNPIVWQGSECTLGTLYLFYTPTERYPLQGIFLLY